MINASQIARAARQGVLVGILLFAGSIARAEETPGDKCSGAIANNGAAASVCNPVCSKAGLKFAGNWSCDNSAARGCGAGKCVCGCAAKPGDKCSGAIADNGAAAGVCGPVCTKLGLRFAGNWSCDNSAARACGSHNCVCGCN